MLRRMQYNGVFPKRVIMTEEFCYPKSMRLWLTPGPEVFEPYEAQGMSCGCVIMRPRGTLPVEQCPAHAAIEQAGSNDKKKKKGRHHDSAT